MMPIRSAGPIAPSLSSDATRPTAPSVSIEGLQGTGAPLAGEKVTSTEASDFSFESALKAAAMETSNLHRDATQKAEGVAAGTLDDLHGTAIAMKESEISLKLVGQIRNKLLDAFHELWRTNV